MEEQRLYIAPPQWPIALDSLVFLWQTADHPNTIYGSDTDELRSYSVRPRRQAHLNQHYAMQLTDGAYLPEGADEVLLRSCQKTNQLTVEAVLTADHLDQQGPGRIISFSTSANARNFTLGQEGGALVFRLRTPHTGVNGTPPQVHLCTIQAGEPTHIVVTYRPGQLSCYRNGERILETDQIQGDFSNWSPQHLLFGDEWNGQRNWAGTLEGIALYNRVLSSGEVQAHARNYRHILLAREKLPRWSVQAELIARSTMPTLGEISPYRAALVVCEYRIRQVEPADPLPGRIRVAHWAILDGQSQAVEPFKEGDTSYLTIEPFSSHPQLASIYLSDTLEPDFDIPLYYAVK